MLLHLAIVGALFGMWYWSAHREHPVQSLGIEARVVSGEVLNNPAPPPPPPPQPAPEPVQQQAPPQEVAPEPAPEPTPTPAELAAQQAEQQRVAEQRRLAQQREEAERKAAAEKAERERQAKAARDKAARDKAAREKAERERLAREKAAREAAAKQARQRREDELSAQLAAEERLAAARASGLQNQYIAQITARIERAWIRPPSATVGLDCEVRVTQVPGGVVTGVVVGRCNGDEAVRQSIEAAVYRASPLPEPPDPSLFDRNLRFNFKPTK